MRVLFILPQAAYPPDSGQRTLTYELLRIAARSYSCDVVGFYGDDDELRSWDELSTRIPGVKVLKLVRRRSNSNLCWRRWHFLLRGRPVSMSSYESEELRVWLKVYASGYDVIHFDTFNVSGFLPTCSDTATVLVPSDAYSLAAFRGFKCCTRVGARLTFLWKWRVYRRHERISYPRFTKVAPVSQEDADWLCEVSPRIDAEALGIPVSDEFLEHSRYPQAESPSCHVIVAGFLSNDAIAEGVCEFLIRVYPTIREAAPGARVTVWGRQPGTRLRSVLQSIQEVELVEHVEDYASFLNSATVYVYPQRYGSGIQTKLQQAMALGKAVVARSETMGALMVRDGVQGFICDDNADMARAIVELLRDEALRCRVGGQARSHVRSLFAGETVAARMAKIYSAAWHKHRESRVLDVSPPRRNLTV